MSRINVVRDSRCFLSADRMRSRLFFIFVVVATILAATSFVSGQIHEDQNNGSRGGDSRIIDYRLPTEIKSSKINTRNATNFRLPTSILPKSYVIEVSPDSSAYSLFFTGRVKITAAVVEATTEIILHAEKMDLYNISVSADGKELGIASTSPDTYPNRYERNDYRLLTIKLFDSLTIGQIVQIDITYTAKLANDAKGFFRDTYVDDSGETRWLVATHLHPTHARTMFPCFDEPAFKATFVLIVNRPSNYKAISNTPLKSSKTICDGQVQDTFEETPLMSTYLLALVVSDFESFVDEKNNFTFWARSNVIKEGEFVLSIMALLLKSFEKVLRHPYPMQKLDLVALPHLAERAMENWGLISVQEPAFFYDTTKMGMVLKQSRTLTIAHEIAHQWFGNQVTPRWWNYIWLSEGLASYLQYEITSKVEPQWALESQFVVDEFHSAFEEDGDEMITHPMSKDVDSLPEIANIFDIISYEKSACVLRMVDKTFGTDLFYDALHDYLEARKYRDATPDHLVQALQSQIDLSGTKLETSLKAIMDTWTLQAGYPIVNVNVIRDVAYLTQARFSFDNYAVMGNGSLWWIPVTWASKSNPDFSHVMPKYWLSEKNGQVRLNVTDEWVVFNVQRSGYYRVNYDSKSWKKIIAILKSDDRTIIHESNRAALIDDLLALASVGWIDYGTALSATQYLINEINYIPWRAAFNGFEHLYTIFQGDESFELYKTHIRTILNPIYEKLGFDEVPTESYHDKLLRIHVVEWACRFDVESCITSSLKYFAAWRRNSTPVPINLRTTIYCTAMKHGSMDDWTFLWQQYSSASMSVEKSVILSVLACSRKSEALEKLLSSAIEGNSVNRFKDNWNTFYAVLKFSSIGAEYMLDFIAQNFADFSSDPRALDKILSNTANSIRTDELFNKLENFFNTQLERLVRLGISPQNYMNFVYNKLVEYDKYKPKIIEWLDQTYPSKDDRLPTNVHPDSYSILLRPHLDYGNFSGKVIIKMNIVRSTSSVVLHANELTIDSVVAYVRGNGIGTSSYGIDETTHRFTIHLSMIVPAGEKLLLEISYRGIINDKRIGIYRSSYIDENGKTRWLAGTRFEPSYARRAFPCFDEPAFKATFRIMLERPNDHRTVSNMPRDSCTPTTVPNLSWDAYIQSFPMSSYQVAFIIIPNFSSLSINTDNLIVSGQPEAVKYNNYALDHGQKVFDFMKTFSGIDYPYPKLDIVAIPDSLSAVAENAGLITLREYNLLRYENEISAAYKQYSNGRVAKAIARMWFGHLVTCEWWNEAWLNEGFAEYAKWIAGHYATPTWNLLQQFVVYELQLAMQFDASQTIRPMNTQVVKPSDIADSSDVIIRVKSASVIRMMQHALGAEVFESGLRTYLKRRTFKSATSNDLSLAIQYHEDMKPPREPAIAIKGLMESWTNHAGYPVVKATWATNTLTLVQERFLLTTSGLIREESSHLYWIPITITVKSESNFNKTRPDFWFTTKEMNSSLILQKDEWFIINIRETGYYRVNYDVDSWSRIIAGLTSENFRDIHEINRAQIIDDLFNLARADYVTYDLAFKAAEYLKKEDNHLPWKAFFNAVAFLYRRFNGHQIGQQLANDVLALVQPIYKKLDFVDGCNENQLDQLNRELILDWSCKLGHYGCIESSRKLFDKWRRNGHNGISPNARPAVYCTSIKFGDVDDWAFLWNEYKETKFLSEKNAILRALGCSRDTDILLNFLNLAISSDDTIRDEDVNTILESISDADSFGVDLILNFLVNNYIYLQKYHGGWTNVANLFHSIASKISTEPQIRKLERFVSEASREQPEITASLNSALDTARSNLAWFLAHSM